MKNRALSVFCILFVVCTAFIACPFPVAAEDKIETLTFAWDQPDRTLLEKWELHWADAAGGPYVKMSDIVYGGEDQASFQNPVKATVSGQPASTVTKYFVLRACGTVDGQMQCSDWSNEVSYDFKIPFGGFQIPVQFRIITQ